MLSLTTSCKGLRPLQELGDEWEVEPLVGLTRGTIPPPKHTKEATTGSNFQIDSKLLQGPKALARGCEAYNCLAQFNQTLGLG